ncbi:hypothetical protein EYZ11_008354 [Aspergillus tanneri]|uniref:Uncharacterized protein n=1 Tax=Aspergillus tanneri TaxID=1220188 RepID=A0A4S3JCT3_9EURO|nr:uncharacterized protein ATNIH1004_011274 [Aspergillus tanneri]KAA8642330.1 hypothetical protein ATNIH1004_011274 [Aspergillus tanneri]THC92167.1 hypothetical protein EYZ11_008354 [Aspergillus tanneri]
MAKPLGRLASESVHVTINPAPRSISESKLVLSALQKYGEVVTFRNLKYDKTHTSPTASQNTILIYDSPQSAKSAIADTPLSIPIPSSSSPSTSITERPSRVDPWSTSPGSDTPAPRTRPRILTCSLQPSRHNHMSALNRNPCYRGFYVQGDSYHAVDLMKTGIPLKELADVPVRWKPAHSKGRWREHVGLSLQEMYKEGFRLEKAKTKQEMDTQEELRLTDGMAGMDDAKYKRYTRETDNARNIEGLDMDIRGRMRRWKKRKQNQKG